MKILKFERKTKKDEIIKKAHQARKTKYPNTTPSYKDGFTDALLILREHLATRSAHLADEFYKLELFSEAKVVENINSEIIQLCDRITK